MSAMVWPLVSRTLAAVLGGYALAHTLSVAVVAAWSSNRADATLAAMQLSFLVFVAAVLWAFAARSLRRVWIGLLLPTALAAVAAWWWL